MKRALCIWLPAWPIQRLVVARPELSGRATTCCSDNEVEQQHSPWQQASVKEAPAQTYSTSPAQPTTPELSRKQEDSQPIRPLALHTRDARRGRIIVCCCPQAQRLGIDLNMPLAEANALHTETLFLEHDSEADKEALSELAVWSEQFSPIVGLEAISPVSSSLRSSSTENNASSLLLDITGLEPIFGGERRLIDLIDKAFAARGYRVSIGTGPTVGAAWAFAHYSTSRGADDLLTLPVAALRLDAQTLDTLQQLGIETISQLLQLPRKALATRLGEPLLDRIDQLLGKKAEVIIAHRAAPHFEAEWSLEHPTRRRDVMEKILEELSLQLSQDLVNHDHAVVQAEATLYGKQAEASEVSHSSSRAGQRTLTISLFQPSNRPQHLSDLLKLQAETLQFRDPIHRVTLTATATVKIHGDQQTLWGDLDAYTAQGAQREIGNLVDRLSSRLGKESVFGICAQAGALPEKSYRPKPLTNTLRKRKAKSAPTLKAPHRPLHLYEPPVSLSTKPNTHTSSTRKRVAPTKKHHGQANSSNSSSSTLHTSLETSRSRVEPASRPSDWAAPSFQFQNQQHMVAKYWGPERIETGWWNGRTVRRDYYRIETTEGCRFWLFRQVNDSAWFLHGSFE